MDGVLSVMVRGLEEELKARMSGCHVYAANQKSPSSQFSPPEDRKQDNHVLNQGADVGVIWKIVKKFSKWVKGSTSNKQL